MNRLSMVIAALLLSGKPVVAEEYPFYGFLTSGEDVEIAQASDAARCALSFFNQKPNGSFVGYHVDMEQFIKTKTVRYVAYNAGTCVYDKAHRLESCHVSTDTDDKSQGNTFLGVIDSIGPTYVKTTGFDTMEEALDYYASGRKAKGVAVTFLRCPFDEARLATMISTAISDLSLEARNKLADPGPELLGASVTAELVKAVGLKAAE